LVLGQSFISFVALAGSLPHLTEISNEIKAIQKMRKFYCGSQQGIEPRHKILGGCHDLLDLNQYAPPLMDLSDP
jgi:hypothetical protein